MTMKQLLLAFSLETRVADISSSPVLTDCFPYLGVSLTIFLWAEFTPQTQGDY